MAQYAYNPFTGNLDRIGDGGSSSGLTDVTATNAGSSVSFEISGTTANMELTDAQFNTVLGEGSGVSLAGGIKNTVLGYNSLNALTTGSGNLVLGNDSGNSLTGGENNNVLLASTGINALSNAIILGNNSHTSFYAAGIANVYFSDYSTRVLCIDPANNQIGWKNFTDGFANTFIGNNAGNATVSGIANTGMGQAALVSLTSGIQNSAYGNGSLLSNTIGSRNSGFGYFTLNSNIDGSDNNALGYASMSNNISGVGNNSIGNFSLEDCLTGNNNNSFGYQTLTFVTSGSGNSAFGHESLISLLTGTNNVAVGLNTGRNYTGAESENILIGSGVLGFLGESNTTRIGNAQTACYISGINGATVTGSAVLCGTDGKLGTVVSSARYKENIEEMDDSVSIMNLKTVKFNYKKDDAKRLQYGLIAEDVNEKFPYLCLYNELGQPETIKYHEICVFLLHEMKKMDKRLQELENK